MSIALIRGLSKHRRFLHQLPSVQKLRCYSRFEESRWLFNSHNKLSLSSNKQDDKPKVSGSDKTETSDKSDGRLKTLVNVEKKQLQKTIVQKRENVRQYFFTRFFNYISNYNEVFEKRFPAAYTVYRVFTVGVKDFYADMKKYFKINSIKNDRGLSALTRKEIEHWKKMPADMMKVAPVLLISALPFANYVVFPLA